MRWRAKPLTCFCLSYIVFVSSAWRNVGMTMTCKRCDVINITWRKNYFLKQVQPNQWFHRDGELRSFSLFTWHEWVMCKEATDKSAQVLIRKDWTKIILHPVTSRSRTLVIGFTVQRVSQPATNSRHSKTNMHLHGQAFGRTQVVCPMAGSKGGKKMFVLASHQYRPKSVYQGMHLHRYYVSASNATALHRQEHWCPCMLYVIRRPRPPLCQPHYVDIMQNT